MDVRSALVASRPRASEYARLLRELPSDLLGVQARLGGLHVYPIKGFGALALEHARIARVGLVDPGTGLADRGMMLAYRKPGTSAEGAYDAIALSNRNEAAFGLTRVSTKRGALVVEADGVAPLRLDPSALAPREGTRMRVKLGYDGGPVMEGVVDDEGPLAAWTRGLLRAHPATRRRYDPADVVAILAPPDHARDVPAKHGAGTDQGIVFGDAAHVLVASSSTLAWMNASLASKGQRAIPMAAFRPNLVLDGLPANAEDVIAEADVAGARLRFATMCIRCDATRVDPATGTRPDGEPLAWLARNRPPRDGDANAATFAINAVFPQEAGGKEIRVGDAVRVLRER